HRGPGAMCLWEFLLELAECFAEVAQLEFGKDLLVDDRAVLQKIVEQIVLLAWRPLVPGPPHDFRSFQLPFPQPSTPDKPKHFPLAVPDVVFAGMGDGPQQSFFPALL